MICSLNEVRTLSRKAAAGSGFSTGLAEDIGRAAAWLCAHEFDGVGAALQAMEGGAPTSPAWDLSADSLVIRRARIGSCGPSALDLLCSGARPSVVLMECDTPLLMVGLAGVAADAHALDVEVSFGDGITATVTRGGTTLSRLPTPGVDVTLTCRPQAGGAHQTPRLAGVSVEQAAWERASVLAARTYVPATDVSRRQGAGAGLTDND